MNTIRLYQFPLSHYCEKARWALSFKGLGYTVKNLLPGFHMKTTKAIAPESSVPVIIDGENIIQGSSEIITYLDDAYPDKPLSLGSDELNNEIMEWERFADKEIGVHIRLVCYHTLLEHPKLLIPIFTHNGPWYGNILLRSIFPGLRKKMRHYMKITPESAKRSLDRLDKALNKLSTHLSGGSYLVGDTFTRADLTCAALIAPFSRPAEYEVQFPEQYPDPLEGIIRSYGEQIAWANNIYSHHRFA